MADSEKGTSIAQYFGLLGLYLPVSYVLAGALSDSISQRWSTSGASLSALLGVVVNFIASKFIDSAGFTTIKMQSGVLSGNAGNLTGMYSGCTVPGMEGFESILAPQSIVIIFAMSTFFLIDITQNQPGQSVSGLIGLTVVLTLIQVFVLISNACWTSDFYVNWPTELSVVKLASKFMIFPILFAGIFGVIGAGLGYLASNSIKQALLVPLPGIGPTGTPAVFCPAGQKRVGSICCPAGQVNDRGQCAAACPSSFSADSSGVCQPIGSLDSATRSGGFGSALPPIGGSGGGGTGASDDNQFVCEAYKNGELITSTITE
jgi:hypothetical protein